MVRKSLSENIRRGKERKSSDEMVGMFNDMTYDLITGFMRDVKAGNIVIDDTTDVMRLFQISLEVNGLSNGASGDGKVPALAPAEREELDNYVNTSIDYNSDGEEEYIVDLDDLANLSQEEVEKMLHSREDTLNKVNGGEQ